MSCCCRGEKARRTEEGDEGGWARLDARLEGLCEAAESWWVVAASGLCVLAGFVLHVKGGHVGCEGGSPTVKSSNFSPIAMMNATSPAANSSPIAIAAAIAIVMRSPDVILRRTNRALSARYAIPSGRSRAIPSTRGR